MFEQELYNNEVIQVESQSGDLFHNYEIKNWVFSPTLYKILAVSAVLNLSVLAFIAQTNLLTRKGCDSPFVGRVCQVLDMAYVGTILFGSEREYVDMEYEKTDLGEAEITYIDVSGETPPLSYPEGYFQIANPVQYAMLHQADNAVNPAGTGFPEFPSQSMTQPMPQSDLLKLRPRPPAANPNAFQDDGATSLFKMDGDGANAGIRKGRRGGRPVSKNPTDDVAVNPKDGNSNTTSPVPTPTPDATVVPADSDEAKEDKFGIFINKRPLKDKAKETIAEVAAEKVKLDSSFKVIIVGTLGLAKDGKTVVLKDPKPMPVDKNIPNDPATVKLAQEWILAVGDAGWFGYLDKLDVNTKPRSKRVIISIEQNDTDFVANIRSELQSANEANTMSTSLRNWITLGALGAKDDELTFLKAATTAAESNTLILNINLPKPIVQQMIQRKLAESKEKENKPNSTALVAPNNKNTAEK